MFREKYTDTHTDTDTKTTETAQPDDTVAPVTYSLRAGEENSDGYYRSIKAVADEFLAEWDREVRSLRTHYMDWLRDRGDEVLRDAREYTFDILTLGVLWRLYGGRVLRISPAATWLCSSLYRLRRRWPRLKPFIDPWRGRIASRVLASDGGEDGSPRIPGRRDLRALLRWMDATGEYREESRRLKLLMRYLSTCIPEERAWYLERVLRVTEVFLARSEDRLGRFTAGVDRFLAEDALDHCGREDYHLVSRKRAEYHLAMLGAELMNRAFRGDYDRAGERAILLPACMRGPSAARCRARRVGLDLVCTHCDEQCRVNVLGRAAAREGASVHVIPHSSDFTRWLRTWAEGRNVGVIGVACVMHLITGGLELRSLGIAAQCVLLDHCGCTQHWDRAGRQTDLNERLLHDLVRRTRHDGCRHSGREELFPIAVDTH